MQTFLLQSFAFLGMQTHTLTHTSLSNMSCAAMILVNCYTLSVNRRLLQVFYTAVLPSHKILFILFHVKVFNS